MRYTQAEKLEIIRLVETSSLSVTDTLAQLDVPRSTFYRWYLRYQDMGPDGLVDSKAGPRQFWNRIPQAVRDCEAQLLPVFGKLSAVTSLEPPKTRRSTIRRATSPTRITPVYPRPVMGYSPHRLAPEYTLQIP